MLHGKKPWIELFKRVHLTSQHKRKTRKIIMSTATTEVSKTVSNLRNGAGFNFFTNTLVHDVNKYFYHNFFIVLCFKKLRI